ncbi:MAG: maleylacetoacetate isomerase [Proteobacteria bacterium]|nr:maleylacetoacetate isomerase [Pseudomonadota bacterium]
MKIHGYFRSSAAYRVRIALNLKNIECDTVLVNLQAGDQSSPAYRAINPQGRVPALETDDHILVQSLAIIEYLDETSPSPPLLPSDPLARARVRGIANIIACDIHPLNNLAVLNYLRDDLSVDEENRTRWYQQWVRQGFDGVEPLLANSSDTGKFCHGDSPGLADICLVPQVFNAQRFNCDLSPYPTIARIFDACASLDAFDKAQPSNQPEAAQLG